MVLILQSEISKSYTRLAGILLVPFAYLVTSEAVYNVKVLQSDNKFLTIFNSVLSCSYRYP